jgi:hypothetical protein
VNRFEKLQEENGTNKIFYLRMHSNKIDMLYNEEADKLGQIYDRKGYPTTLFNGGSIVRVGMSDQEVDAAINKEWNKKAQFSVQLEGRFAEGSNGKKLDFVGTVDRLDNLATDKMKYVFVAFENGFEEGSHIFNHVIRLIEPSAQGGSLRFADESRKVIKRSIELKDEWIRENVGFAFFIWDADTLEIHNYSLWNMTSLHLVTDLSKPVPAGKKLDLTFDKELESSTISNNTMMLTTSSGEVIDINVKVAGKKVTVEPSSGLEDGSKYTLYLLGNKPGIKAIDKSMLDDNQIITFTSEAMKAPIITVDVTSVDFGIITEKASKSFSISNTGTDTLTGTINSQDAFVTVEPTEFSVDPGSSQTITVKTNITGLEPAAKKTTLKIESNAGNSEIPVAFTYEKPEVATPPALEITQAPPETTNENITLTGASTPGAKVTVDSKPATVDSNGKFTVAVKLQLGNNTLKVVAEKDGLKTEKTISVFRFIQINLQLDNKTMSVNGIDQQLSSAPTSSSPPLPKDLSGSTYMPIRPVAEALYATIGWDGATQKVTISQKTPDGKNKNIELWIGKKQAKINGTDQWIDSKQKLYPANVGGKTMLPLRFTANSLGADVAYEPATKKITIKFPMR